MLRTPSRCHSEVAAATEESHILFGIIVFRSIHYFDSRATEFFLDIPGIRP